MELMTDRAIAPSLMARQMELERQFAAYGLDKKISLRPTAQKLRDQNVLFGNAENDEVITTASAVAMEDHFIDPAGTQMNSISYLSIQFHLFI
jgi:hypothetical protein